MSQVTFFIIPADHPGEPVPAHVDLACRLAGEHYRAGQTVYLNTGDQQQAYAVDEHLWQFEPDSFVAHNLQGDGWAPVLIGWQGRPDKRRDVLINLAETVPEFAAQFANVIDFVPSDERLKQLARDRYKAYRQAGLPLKTRDLTKDPL